jgi:hypothetical protein
MEVFDEEYAPGARAPHSGVFACKNCGHAITHVSGDVLPSENHHQHDPSLGPIVWKIIVWG